MISYKLYCENKNRADIVELVKKAFPTTGATFYAVAGLWQGITESSLVIEIVGHENDYADVTELAQFIKLHNKQQAVLVTTTEIVATLI